MDRISARNRWPRGRRSGCSLPHNFNLEKIKDVKKCTYCIQIVVPPNNVHLGTSNFVLGIQIKIVSLSVDELTR